MDSSNPAGGDDFVNICFAPAENGINEAQNKDKLKDFYSQWVDKASGQHSGPPLTGADALRRLYPKHSLVMTQGYGINLLSFPAIQVTPLEKTPLVTNLVFIPIARSLGSVPGLLVDQVNFGAFKLSWLSYEFLVYLFQYPLGLGIADQYFILYEGPQEVSRLLLLAAGSWSDQLHEEIWVYNQGNWQKDHALWEDIQKADWDEVILKDSFKKALQKDIYGFFDSESTYRSLGIPWKRGLIMYGPPGNGKTISLKIIMKTCGLKGFYPLYVKSFQSWKGEEASMADVFDKARQLSPALIILEDLDSLINDKNRSFFLNQLDGLQSNDGLLIIVTTNHFDRLDPGLSTRPSRFDRKYKFDDPDLEERKLYVQYWQKKLASNNEIDFSDKLVDDVAQWTDRFSFAYLKEAFVSALVTFLGIEGTKPVFADVLQEQVDILRKQLDKQFDKAFKSNAYEYQSGSHHAGPSRSPTSNQRDIRTLLDTLSQPRTYESGRQTSETESGSNRDIRALLDAMSDSLSLRTYESAPPHRRYGAEDPGNEEGKNFRALLDRMSTQGNKDIPADWSSYPANPLQGYNSSAWRPAPTPSSSEYFSFPASRGQNIGPNAGAKE